MTTIGAVIGRAAVPGRAAARAVRAVAARRPSPRMQRFLLIAVAAFALLTSFYFFWLRDSTFVRVERVTVTGLDTRDAARVRNALTVSARSMTTLHVDRQALLDSVQGFPVVRDIRVSSDFPHGLQIVVIQHTPAAIAIADGLRVPVAGDGTLLRGVTVEGELPTIQVSGALGTDRLKDRDALQEAKLLGGAPVELRSRLLGVNETEDKGLSVEMDEGPELIFGDTTRIRDKWDAASRVLADPTAKGATYIDVRLPDRPAAGGVAAETVTPVAPAGGIVEEVVPDPAAPATTTPDPTATEPGAEQATPAAPEQTAPVAPETTEPAPPAAQQVPQQQAPPAEGTAGGGATPNSQP